MSWILPEKHIFDIFPESLVFLGKPVRPDKIIFDKRRCIFAFIYHNGNDNKCQLFECPLSAISEFNVTSATLNEHLVNIRLFFNESDHLNSIFWPNRTFRHLPDIVFSLSMAVKPFEIFISHVFRCSVKVRQQPFTDFVRQIIGISHNLFYQKLILNPVKRELNVCEPPTEQEALVEDNESGGYDQEIIAPSPPSIDNHNSPPDEEQKIILDSNVSVAVSQGGEVTEDTLCVSPVSLNAFQCELQTDVVEHLSSEDENDETEVPTTLKLQFQDGSFFMMPMDSYIKNIAPNAWLNDIMIDFLMEYIMKNMLTVADREVVHIFDTSFFSRLYRHKDALLNHMNKIEMLDRLLDRIYPKRKNKRTLPIFDKPVLVVPVFWENHWFLCLIQNCTAVASQYSKARIIIIDSKMRDPLNLQILGNIHNHVFAMMKTWIQMMVYTQIGCIPVDRFSFVRCQKLPDQTNNYDCGIFLVTYAAFFSKNRNWMNIEEEEELREFGVPNADRFPEMIHRSRAEIKEIIKKTSLTKFSLR